MVYGIPGNELPGYDHLVPPGPSPTSPYWTVSLFALIPGNKLRGYRLHSVPPGQTLLGSVNYGVPHLLFSSAVAELFRFAGSSCADRLGCQQISVETTRLRRASKNQEPTATEMHDTSKQVQPPVAPKRSGGGNIGLTILATSLGFVLVQLDVSIVNIALAKIGADLGTAVAGLQWIVDSYALAFAALLLSAGALGDQIGARKGFIVGFAAFVAASLGCGLAPGPIALDVARAFQGIGAALLVPCSLALLNQAAGNDTRLRARAVSLWTASGSVALAVGPVLGGFLVDSLGWRSIFLINIPIGLAGIFLTQTFVEESPSRHHTFDPAGQLFAITTLLGLVGAVICSEGSGFSPIVWCALIIAFVSGAAFVSVESRVSSPMLPVRFLSATDFHRSDFDWPRCKFHALWRYFYTRALPSTDSRILTRDERPDVSAVPDRSTLLQSDGGASSQRN